ncbi:Asp/Glu racemase [Kiloniella sp.]|uniref:maleate cis-trans isomerase family protein n=1 Tax=Kiloniella sp. TaxID=1938587 RepID=UPI003B012920
MKLNFDIDQASEAQAKLGLIILQADETLENELRLVLQDPDIALYHSRIPSHPNVTKETLAQMALDLPTAAGLLPNSISFDAIGYACTSGATVIGQKAVAEKIHQYHPGVAVTDPISAVIAGCRALGVDKLGFLTPYVPEVSEAMRQLLEDNGLTVTGFGSFEQEQEKVVSRIAEASTLDAIVEIGKSSECDAIFVSCTNLRTFGILAKAERILGKPVISSNLALLWHLMRLAGVKGRASAPGLLFNV